MLRIIFEKIFVRKNRGKIVIEIFFLGLGLICIYLDALKKKSMHNNDLVHLRLRVINIPTYRSDVSSALS